MQKHHKLDTNHKKEHWRRDAMRADSAIKHCKKCKNCWQIVSYSSGNGQTMWMPTYYRNFVSYGKQKETCPRCTGT